MKKFLLFFAMLLSANSEFFAQMPEFNPEVKRVAVFKNGYAFTYREGEATTSNGWAYTTRTPIGVLGTVWGYSTAPNTKVMQLLASEAEKSEIERVTDIADILLANEGARIRFVDAYSNPSKSFEGTYEILSKNREFKLSSVSTIQEINIALKTETGVMFFPITSIRNVEILGQPKLEKPKKTKEFRLSMKVDGVTDGQKINLGIAALERGIRWIPAYRVEVKGEPIKEAKLELEAMLINDIADLKNSDVYFVVGVPSFQFQNEISPLSLNATFAGVNTGFRRDQNLSNAIMTQTASRESAGFDDGDISPTSPDEEKANSFSAEQLYLYQANQINLKKGERMSQRLFSLTVPCSEVFEWTLDDSSKPDDEYARTAVITQPLTNKVWYGLRLKNTIGMPWTTAPAISFRDWKPLGQNLLSFTPTGGDNILRVTPATEVIGTHKLEEKTREPKQMRFSGSTYDYDLVTVEGTIKVKNLKKQPIELVLTRNVTGDVLLASDGGKVTREGFNLQAVNPNSLIRWNLTLPTGEKEIKYTYKIYVRR